MKLLKNKFTVGILCIVLGLLFSFVAIPMMLNGGQSVQINAVRITQNVQSGTQLTADMVETVSVPETVVKNGISDTSSVIGQYAATDLYAGDYLTASKLSPTLLDQSAILAGEAKGKVVLSVTLPSLASGVSGRLLPGDIVTVMVVPKGTTSQTLGIEPTDTTKTVESGAYIDPVLEYIEVCMVTTSDGSDAVVDATPDEEVGNTLPVTVSFFATREQALKLAELEQEGTIYLAFVARGDAVSNYVPDSVLTGTEAD